MTSFQNLPKTLYFALLLFGFSLAANAQPGPVNGAVSDITVENFTTCDFVVGVIGANMLGSCSQDGQATIWAAPGTTSGTWTSGGAYYLNTGVAQDQTLPITGPSASDGIVGCTVPTVTGTGSGCPSYTVSISYKFVSGVEHGYVEIR